MSHKKVIKAYLSKYVGDIRVKRGWTKKKMADQLRISFRSYSDLEKGIYCLSASSLLFLLLMLDKDEVSEFLDGFRDLMQSSSAEDSE